MLAVIPAKGTSERLPGKNMLPLLGKPLLGWTIEAAQESGCFFQVIVSSEDEAIQDYAWKEMNVAIHKRDPALSTPKVTTFEVVKEVLRYHHRETFCLLLPTSPLRKAEDIQAAYERFTSSRVDCLMSVTPFVHPLEWALRVEHGRLFPASDRTWRQKRQSLSTLWKHEGAIIMARTEPFMEARDWLDLTPIPFEMPEERSLDVNTEADFLVAEAILGGQDAG